MLQTTTTTSSYNQLSAATLQVIFFGIAETHFYELQGQINQQQTLQWTDKTCKELFEIFPVLSKCFGGKSIIEIVYNFKSLKNKED